MNNSIYIRRRNKICVPYVAQSDSVTNVAHVASIVRNVEALGYTFSKNLFEALQGLSLKQLSDFYDNFMPIFRYARGAHRDYNPMYPNFPDQVMEASEAELFINAMIHYWSSGTIMPEYRKKERLPIAEDSNLTVIDLGNEEEFKSLFAQILGSNTSLSAQDKEDIDWYLRYYGLDIDMMPSEIPQKENRAYVANLIMFLVESPDVATEYLFRYFSTPTDVLRLAVAMSNGDVSLAKACKFRNFKRSERALLLSLLSRTVHPVEDMLKWKNRWIRLGEKLHVGEYADRFPKAYEAFRILRNNEKVETFNGVVEKSLLDRDISTAVGKLVKRPGELARRLDHLVRISTFDQRVEIVSAFSSVVEQISTPVLLQVRQHFASRNNESKLRVFFPKGNVAKAKMIDNDLPVISEAICFAFVRTCEEALSQRFSAMPSLGNVYVDEGLKNYLLPFSQRSASKALKTLVRGSKVDLESNKDTLRFFVWWMNGNGRTDIDLSASTFDKDFNYIDVLSYYNLRGLGGCHSGDIVDAPDGASEFIDISLSKVAESGARYIVMTLNVYRGENFVELPECFAGWMLRESPQSGEIFEPKTVQNRFDITADMRIAVPLIIDVVERQVIWCDLSLKHNNFSANHVEGNKRGINATLQSMTSLNKPNMYDLLRIHASARGVIVDSPEEADVVFSVENDTPQMLETIASEYMA